MNNTMNSFFKKNKYRTIPISSNIQNKSTDNENKYNYSNQLNQIESVKVNTINTNSNLQTENSSNERFIKRRENKAINSIKHLSIKRKRNFNNNINILDFNKDICSKTTNNNFSGKKILLSKYPYMNKNQKSRNEKNLNNNINNEHKTFQINTTFFEKNNVQKYMNINQREYFVTKIEKELTDLLNKEKNDKIENFNDNNKNRYNNSYYSLINNKQTRMKIYNGKLFKDIKDNNIIKENDNKVSNIKKEKKNLYNQYLNSNLIKRKVLFIDRNNNTITNDNTITLLKDEKDLLLEKFMINKDDTGNKINLPLLQNDNKFINNNKHFLTEFNNKLINQNTGNEQEKSGSLSKLIKDKFSMHNYKNMKISLTTKEYAYYNPNWQNNETKNDETFDNFNINIGQNKINNIFIQTKQKRARTRNQKRKSDLFSDLFGVIQAKTIGPKINKNKSKNKNIKIEIKNKEKEKEKINTKGKDKKYNKKMKYNKLSSQPNIIISIYRKLLKNKEKEIKNILNKPITLKDKGKKLTVTLVEKDNKILPVDEKGEEIKHPKLLIDLYQQIKSMLNIEKEKLFLKKRRLSYNPLMLFKNPIKIAITQNKNNSSLSSIISESISKEESVIKLNESINIKQENEKKEKTDKKEKPILLINKSPFKKRKSNLFSENKISLNHIKSQISKDKIGDKQIKSKRQSISKEEKNKNDTNEFIYKEEDDFIKDFNFEFDSSEDENSNANIQKLMRQNRKKINKYLFEIFQYIAKIANIENFKKEDLTKLLIDKDFRNTFRLLKEQIIRQRELVRDSLDPEGKDKKKKIYIKDMEIINYLYKYITDKNSLFYKSIYKRIKKEQKEEEEKLNKENNYEKMFDMLRKSSKDEVKSRQFSLYTRNRKGYAEDNNKKRKIESKKFFKKKINRVDLEFISQDEKKRLIMGEINLTNEIRYQISISHDKESKEKFKNLLNKIESLRNLSGDEYVKSLKKNFLMFKDEAEDILKAKEIEERLNGFINDLNDQRNNLKDKQRFIMSLLLIKDNKFLSSFENEVSE